MLSTLLVPRQRVRVQQVYLRSLSSNKHQQLTQCFPLHYCSRLPVDAKNYLVPFSASSSVSSHQSLLAKIFDPLLIDGLELAVAEFGSDLVAIVTCD